MTQIVKSEAIARLEGFKEQATAIMQGSEGAPELAKWRRDTEVCIGYTFGLDSKQVKEFSRIIYTVMPSSGSAGYRFGKPVNIISDNDYQRARQNGLRGAIIILSSMIDEIRVYWSETPPEVENVDFWALLHPVIVAVARSRFDAAHYADAVEAALKEVNVRVKNYHRAVTGVEFDGSKLMQATFSLDKPVISLDNLNTETGRSIQLGYLQIFAGAITGIRNPKAHGNITITPDRAIHHLFGVCQVFGVNGSLVQIRPRNGPQSG